MNTQITVDKIKDRIVEINGFNLYGHEDFRPNRRNLIYYSDKLQLYILLHGLSNNNSKHTTE